MSIVSLATYLAGLTPLRLTQLLEHRPDVLVEPAPRTLHELALRLNGVDSLSQALPVMNRDEVVVAQVIAMLGDQETAALAARFDASEADVRQVVDGLCASGLAWEVDGRVGLPERLAEHFAGGLDRFRPLAVIARQARVDDLRTAVVGLGGDPAALRKPGLIARLEELLNDPKTVVRAVEGLPPAARRRLALLERGDIYFGGFGERADPITALTRAGLLVNGPYHQPELPREVAVVLRLGEVPALTGRPTLPAAAGAPDDGRAGAEAALLAVTTVLDEARRTPLAKLKKGGVGARERTRLAKRLGLAEPALSIDVASSAGLLAQVPDGYAATGEYAGWREADAGLRWARLVLAWFDLELAPTSRETDDGEVAPPVPMTSAAGMLRRALLRAAADGRSLRAAAEQIDWYCPLHGYDDSGRSRKITAALHEAALIGVVVKDRLSALGEHLVAVAGRPDAADELARRVADLLPTADGLLVLQSDLTAVVSGQSSAEAARLLAAAATPETHGAAATWRFTPASVRGALDAGWSADELRAELTAVSDRPLPQPLDYLISDVARRHGAVRVREVRACVTGAEPEIAEILGTRSLRSLHLRRLAPTVLATSAATDEVLSQLRAAGFAPMPEDADGIVVVPERERESAPEARTTRARARIPAVDLAFRLLTADPGSSEPVAPMHRELANLASGLDAAEVALLADAVEHGRDVRILYRNGKGNRTVRDIRPQQLYGRWLHAWCHLRSAEREFTLAGIESVSPVG
jgi:hypothetical protein